MADRVLRDHSQSCEHDGYTTPLERLRGHFLSTTNPDVEQWCPGGREVTATEIQEMAYSLWQAEQMDEYHRDVL